MGNCWLSITSRKVCFFSSSVPLIKVLRHVPHCSRAALLLPNMPSICRPMSAISFRARFLGAVYEAVFTAEKKPPITATERKVSIFLSTLNTPVSLSVSKVLSPTIKAFSTLPSTSSRYSPVVPFQWVAFSKSVTAFATLVDDTLRIKSLTKPKPILSRAFCPPFEKAFPIMPK